MAAERDDGHRLTVERFGKILAITSLLFADEALPVEVEYEDGLISQFPLEGLTESAGDIWLHLGTKHTDCLAREACGVSEDSEGCGCGDPERKTACC
jgi:hypothetical protein